MNIKVTYDEQVRFVAEARGHKVFSDQPLTSGGTDKGMTPPELLLASLGTCAAHYAVEYLRARNLPAIGIEISVDAEKVLFPARLDKFRIRIDGLHVDERHREGVLRAAKKCLIHNTLLQIPEIEVEAGNLEEVLPTV